MFGVVCETNEHHVYPVYNNMLHGIISKSITVYTEESGVHISLMTKYCNASTLCFLLPPLQSGAEVKASHIIDIKEIRMVRLIGQGGFGAVYEGKWQKKTVAVKMCLGNLVENLSQEIKILTALPPHSNVLAFFGVALSSDSLSSYIITELASHGSLYDYLHVKKNVPSPDQSLAWALQVASGMYHLHRNNVVHRDLKSGNILLSLGLVAKVCDFGTAHVLAKTAMTRQKGIYRWMAPEIVQNVEANINKMCDVFSYGMVLYEIYDHKIPFADIPDDALLGTAIVDGKRPPVPDNLPPFLYPLLEACWEKEPNKRPLFQTIVMAIQTSSFD